MKALSLLQSILSAICIVLIAAFGAFAVVQSVKKITSKVAIIVNDENINVGIVGEAGWVSDPSSKYFNTSSTSSGLTESNWLLPNITFSSSQNNAILNLSIENNNETQDLAVNISGIAYDSEIDSITDYRFTTNVYYSINNGLEQTKKIDKSNINLPQIKLPAKDANSEFASSLQIKIVYHLDKENQSFNLEQNIKVDITNWTE